MHAWPSFDVPTLPGRGKQLRLYDTSTATVAATTPGSTARMYVCGITPYDATHLGHAATYLAFDLVQRVWRDAGHQVHYVQNVTDVDDPLLERAAHTGENWHELAEREIALFREDMTALHVLAPAEYIGAVEAVPEITEAITTLLASGAAYRVREDIYFDITAAPHFGSESGYDRETMLRLFGERGGDPDHAGKRDPLDPLLWRGRRDGEPFWDSAIGAGRPGWHIECSVIALNRLGTGFDVQGGGSDLIFPHHEHSAAHAEALSGQHPFANQYVHTGMIGLDGEKMSKSRGNLVLVSKLRAAGVDPMAIRLALLDGHYRADREWTGGRLRAAEERLGRWRVAVGVADGSAGSGSAGSGSGSSGSGDRAAIAAADAVLAEMRARLADDLDTLGAIAAVDRWAEAAAAAPEASAGALIRDASDALLGVTL